MLGKIITLVMVLALSGCTQATPREEVEISIIASEVPINGNTQKIAKCDGDGLLEYTTGASEAGIVHVQIRDGNGFLIGGEELGAEESGSDSLQGAPGKWNMRVDLDRTFEGTFKFTLTC